MRSLKAALLLSLLASLMPTLKVGAQVPALPIELRANPVPYNYRGQSGVPLSHTAGTPEGSDGRAPASPPPTPGQFGAVFSTGGVIPSGGNWNPANSYLANAEANGLPKTNTLSGGHVILRSGSVGAPYVLQGVSFLFGEIISPPEVNENGTPLADLPTPIRPEDYWLAEPRSSDNHTNATYYYSPHAKAVFANQAGPVSVVWIKAQPATTEPPGIPGVTNYLDNGFWYTAMTNRVVVSGRPFKGVRRMYWTEGNFRLTGKAVNVPAARVGNVVIAYNDRLFPDRVDETYVDPGQVGVTTNATLQETRTLWYDKQLGQIYAYNHQGRAFLELLGDTREDGTRQHLGYEIVDVRKEPVKYDVTTELGDRVNAYQDGRDDTHLFPDPILNPAGTQFGYRHNTSFDGRTQYFAEIETQYENDYLIHWMEAGEQGLLWPLRLVRNKFIWPPSAERYNHYVRPEVATERQAKETAVPLSPQNVPVIAYQDPLDRPRASLTEQFAFYSFLEPEQPANRALLRFTVGQHLKYERVFSWLAPNLDITTTQFTGTVATNLATWNPTNQVFDWPDQSIVPRVVNEIVNVGQRILPPSGEIGAEDDYLAGYILESQGTSYHVNYLDPFAVGFEEANKTAIIPVNVIPGDNNLEVWWFRETPEDFSRGFKAIHWPSAIGRYTIQWPTNPQEIVLASNAGSGGLGGLEAKGLIYNQPDPALPGYNPNEEHALMLGGQVYALRDDLNLTGVAEPASLGTSYSSDPWVLLQYTDADGRISVTPFQVFREKPDEGILFDYVTEAGSLLQAPMPLPLLPAPVATVQEYDPNSDMTLESPKNFNQEVAAANGDLPTNWNPATDPDGSFGHYGAFTYEDRKNSHWVYRGLHAGRPDLAAGSYNETNKVFDALPNATAVVNEPFSYHIHVSRRINTLTLSSMGGAALPAGLEFAPDGLYLTGTPTAEGANTVNLVITDTSDGSAVNLTLMLDVVASGGTSVTQGPLAITSQNDYAGQAVTYTGRPPYLALSPKATNSFTMRFYYKTLEGFEWPGINNPPAVGTVVPYLRKPDGANGYIGAPHDKATESLEIVYRPAWPAVTPTLQFGETLLGAKNGLPAVRGQSSVQVLYQQSIASDITAADASVTLHDPTREKTSDLVAAGLDALPAGLRTELNQGFVYFPNLPPHLIERLFFDPNRGEKGQLVFRGEYKDEILGEKYVLLNVLGDTDLETVKDLVPATDTDYSKWDDLVLALATPMEPFIENPAVLGTYIPDEDNTTTPGISALAEVLDDDVAVDSYALSAGGPGMGYVTFITGNGEAFTPAEEPVSIHVIRVGGGLYPGEMKVLTSPNPLSELITFQHTADLAGQFQDYEYEWKIAPPVDGLPPQDLPGGYQDLTSGNDIPRYTLGGAGIEVLVDNYLIMRYRPTDDAHPLYNQWSDWTEPRLAEGWIKRVLAGINPFNQRITDLFNNSVNTDVSLITQAGTRWEGDVALSLNSINEPGLIEIYETVLNRGKNLSIDAGINFGGANDALLLAAGYINDLYMMLGNEAWADAQNPTIGIGTTDQNLGDISTALFAFKGQTASLLEEELALIRGRDDFLQPGVGVAPVYNRLIWNYTRGIDSGEVVYALNYNIQENPNEDPDGIVNAEDAAYLYPQGHGDAYGHYLTALKGYYKLLVDNDFDWVPRIETVNILGVPVSVDYLDERKFAAAAAATANAGRQAVELTWRQSYQHGSDIGWEHLSQTRTNSTRTYNDGGQDVNPVRHWGVDHWATRSSQGAYFNWIVGNAILPEIDPDPNHEGIQKIDRTTVTELRELVLTASKIQTTLDNAEGRLSPLGLPQDSLAFDTNPSQIVGADANTHFEQIYQRALQALSNAVTAFDDAKDVTARLRSEQNSLLDLQAQVVSQELAFKHQLIEIYGTPYPDDIGPGRTYVTGYDGPDLIHYSYVETPEMSFGGLIPTTETEIYQVDIQQYPEHWATSLFTKNDFHTPANSDDYILNEDYVVFEVGPHGFFDKPDAWTGSRKSPGRIQQAISAYIKAHFQLQTIIDVSADLKADLDQADVAFNARVGEIYESRDLRRDILIARDTQESVAFANDVLKQSLEFYAESIKEGTEIVLKFLPDSLIAGTAVGGDLSYAAGGAARAAGWLSENAVKGTILAASVVSGSLKLSTDLAERRIKFDQLEPLMIDHETRQAVTAMVGILGKINDSVATINLRLRELDEAKRQLAAEIAAGDRVQQEREIYRKKVSSLIQGYRTRDAGFRIFRNEKLERYQTLFDLASRYTLIAANAYDYETGLLNTARGRDFVSRIVGSRALGVVVNGTPAYAGSNTGDPGLSSVLAEMKADWDVLEGRLGFNNPDAYGTTVSLRTELFRILPDSEGDLVWRDVLENGRVDDLLADPDIRRHCMQIDNGSGLSLPGIVLDFNTVIADGVNLFGNPLAAGDHTFSPSSFATKIHAAGIALEGYQGMDDPDANAAVSESSPSDPDLAFLDPKGLSATPYIYLIPVGVDSMRSPPLGDQSAVRTWAVNDVTIPLPFNIGGSDFSSRALYQSSDSLSEPLFGVRKHQAFRPVSSSSVFSSDIYGDAGEIALSQFTNRRLIGRSVWNSRWKIVIPGRTLLANPEEGLDRFLQTVKDVRIHLVTYSYSGN